MTVPTTGLHAHTRSGRGWRQLWRATGGVVGLWLGVHAGQTRSRVWEPITCGAHRPRRLSASRVGRRRSAQLIHCDHVCRNNRSMERHPPRAPRKRAGGLTSYEGTLCAFLAPWILAALLSHLPLSSVPARKMRTAMTMISKEYSRKYVYLYAI